MFLPCGVGIAMTVAGLVCLSLGIVNDKTELWGVGIVVSVIGMALITIIMYKAVTGGVTEHVNPVMKKNKSDTNLELMAMDDTSISHV
jgi:hypothetical protein